MYNNVLQQQMAMLLQNQIQYQQQFLMQQQQFQMQPQFNNTYNNVMSSGSSVEDDDDEEKRTLYVANLDEKVTHELLYELFLQAGPLESVRIPKDNDGKARSFGFVQYMHQCSVPYALELFGGMSLFRKPLTIKPKYIEEREMSSTKQRRMQQQDAAFYGAAQNAMLPHNHADDARNNRRVSDERDRERDRDYDRRYQRGNDRQRRQQHHQSGSNRHTDQRHMYGRR